MNTAIYNTSEVFQRLLLHVHPNWFCTIIFFFHQLFQVHQEQHETAAQTTKPSSPEKTKCHLLFVSIYGCFGVHCDFLSINSIILSKYVLAINQLITSRNFQRCLAT